MIDAYVELIPILGARRRGDQVVRQRRRGRHRIRIHQLGRHRVPAVTGNDVAGEGLAREGPSGAGDRRQRVVDRDRQLAEVPLPHLQGRHGVDEHPALLLAEPVVIGEEEGPVLDDRAPDGPAELTLLERRLLLAGAVGEEVVGVEPVVAQEAVARAVNRVAAGLGDDVDLSAGIAPLLGGEQVGLDLELLDRFHVGAHDDDQRQARVVVDPVVEVVVRVLPVAVHEQLGAGSQVVGPCPAHDRAAHAGAGAGHAGTESGQLHEVASVERQILHLLLLDHAAQHGRLVFEQRRGALDEDGLAQADFQVQVDLGALIHLQLHARALDLAKARGFGGERVAAGLQRREDVVAVVAGRGGTADAGGLVDDHHLRGAQDRAGTVLDRPDQIGGSHLGVRHRRRKQ